MAELGATTDEAHRAVGERAARLGLDALVAVGEGARGIVAGFELAGGPGRPGRTAIVVEPGMALDALGREIVLVPGDAVLVKGSRIAGLEAVAHALVEGAPAPVGEPCR
jgi:UDP-N-acetylmuramoyl-tripeptide--D-alanyl-D-alanine ligase